MKTLIYPLPEHGPLLDNSKLFFTENTQKKIGKKVLYLTDWKRMPHICGIGKAMNGKGTFGKAKNGNGKNFLGMPKKVELPLNCHKKVETAIELPFPKRSRSHVGTPVPFPKIFGT